jgi:hypothetical protein
MNNNTKKPLADCDAIVEWLLYSWDKRYVTSDVLRQNTGLSGTRLFNAVRRLATSYGVLAYSRKGEYEIIDVERYFATPEPGCQERWLTPQLYK